VTVSAPGPRGLPLLGSLVPMVRDPLGFVERLHRDHGPSARFALGPDRYLMVSEPDALQHVFIDRHTDYVKGGGYDGVRLVLRTGLLASDGEAWKARRQVTQPLFRPDRLARYVGAIDEAVAAAHRRWEARGEIDLYAELVAITIDVVGRTLLGGPLAHRAPEVSEALEVAIAFAWSYGNEPVRLPTWLPTPGRRRFWRSLAALDAIATEAAAQGGDGDLVSVLLGGGVDADGRRDEAVDLLLAGHETTATALTFAISAVLLRPDLVERLRAEILPATPAHADVQALGLAASVLYESLRLWPPVWFFERRAAVDDVVAGFPVPAGTMVGAAPWAIQRHPDVWPDPTRFDPDRFASGPPSREARFRWMPFSLGPRTCVGMRLAILEAQIVLARTFQRFELVPLGPPPVPVARLTLRPSPGTRVRVVPRRAA
jgi:enediyne biosynthesis protein E7